MVASVIEELSPKDERTKLLREKLAIIQEAQVSALSAGFAAASHLQLLCRDAFGFQPQVMSTVKTTLFEGSHVLSPLPKVLQNQVRTIRQADRIAGSSVSFIEKHRESKSSTKATSSRKTASRSSVFDRLGPYCHHDPENSDTRAALSHWRQQGSPPPTLSRQPQEALQVFCGFLNQTTLTGPRWGLAWQTLPHTGGVCWATAGPPALFRTGWALHSSNDLSSPISASASGPETAGRTSSKPCMPCCSREL